MKTTLLRHALPFCLAVASLGCLPDPSMALQERERERIPDAEAFDSPVIAGQMRQLKALILEIGKRDPVPQQEYEQAKLLAEGLVGESRRPGFFWLELSVDAQGGEARVPAHGEVSYWMAGLTSVARRVSEKEHTHTARMIHDFLLRLFRDPETRRLQRLALTGRNAVNEAILFSFYLEGGQFAGLRGYLRSQDLISTDDWILDVSGLLWEGPQQLIWRDDIAFASLESLQESGARIVASNHLVTVWNRDQRLDLPIINSMDPAGRAAYRNPDGRLYIPVEELARRKVASVRISPDPKEKTNKAISGSQIVYISPRVEPRYITAPDRIRLPETRRKPSADK